MEKDIINKIIRNRKSVYPKDYSKKEIPRKLIEEVLLNANHAPTHRLTQPWFFRVYEKSSKETLCKLIDDINDKKYSPTTIKKYIEKIRQSDTVISVFMKRDEQDRVPEWEEIAAVSMAIQNMWLTCYENNIGCYLSTPRFKDEYGKLIGLNENERSLGFFFMGSYDHKESLKIRDDINNKVEWI